MICLSEYDQQTQIIRKSAVPGKFWAMPNWCFFTPLDDIRNLINTADFADSFFFSNLLESQKHQRKHKQKDDCSAKSLSLNEVFSIE